jgi:phosphopentomutase
VAAAGEKHGASRQPRPNSKPGRRAIVLVIDACGVGALPDAASYGDAGTNTLLHVAEAVGGLQLPTLQALGLGSILPLPGVPGAARPVIHGRLHALGPGKDSTAGHWELMGVVLERSLPTYPEGFPPEILARLREATGKEMICNLPYNGISAIEDFGAEHLESGALILYTSQDSVLQLAAHIERVPVQELWRACAAAREAMSGEHAVGRVIARPFRGPPKAFERTDGRRDFALAPPSRSYLQELADAGVQTHGVGKISDLFAGVGIASSHPGATNSRALASVSELLDELERGLVFANLIETDQIYGHRKDAHGFHRALRTIDGELGGWLARLRPDDLLVVTADHGVDPAHPGTDHTREHAPLLALTGEMLSAGEAKARHDGPLADVGATVLRWLTGRETAALPGRPFL